jgi:hypothetical protein
VVAVLGLGLDHLEGRVCEHGVVAPAGRRAPMHTYSRGGIEAQATRSDAKDRG